MVVDFGRSWSYLFTCIYLELLFPLINEEQEDRVDDVLTWGNTIIH